MYSLFFLYLSEQIYKIMKIKLLLISFLLAANALGAAAQVSKTYYVSKPGTLISMMTEEEANSVTHLTLTGKLNAEDFRHLRDEFANLKVLDISNAEIKMYSGKAGTYPNGKFYIYMPNLVSVDISRTNATAIPDFTFAQKKYLLNMKLPHNLKSIGQRVFSNCGRLCGTLELPASVTAIEFGAFMGCDNLRYVLATGNKITTLGDNLFGEGVPSKLVYKK